MPCLGYESFAEFTTAITFVLLGMSIMMVPSAITSAPGFVTGYYMYATGDPNAVCEKPFFWDNANTFYNVATYAMQVLVELFCLTPIMRRVPLEIRLYVGLCVPILEMVLFVTIPAVTIPTQDGAIAVLMVVGVMGGFSKALVDSTTNALVGPFPTKFFNLELWGLAVVAVLMSTIECILKASMASDFDSVLTQSRIYFGIGMGIQAISLFMMAILHHNPFAQRYTAEYRVKALRKSGALPAEDDSTAAEPIHEIAEGSIQDAEMMGGMTNGVPKGLEGEEEDDVVRATNTYDAEDDTVGPTGNAAVLRATGDADKMVDADQTGVLTSSDQMLRVSVFSVVKRVWPMLGCIFLIFFTSLFLFPGLFFRIDPSDKWFGTIVVLLFNVGDFVSRILLMFPVLRPKPMHVVAGTLGRIVFVVPLLVCCVRGLIDGHWMPYILITIIGLTNGYFGAQACVHCPRTTSLRLAGERSLAAMLAGVFIMFGLCAGSNFALLLNLTI